MTIPQTLKERLAARRVIPFVGAGVSMAVCRKDNGTRLFPSWKELLCHAADSSKQEGKEADARFIHAGLDLDAPDFLSLAEHTKKCLGPGWCPFLNKEFNYDRELVQDESLSLPQALWRLGSKLIVTTNYDKVLRWSCPSPADCESWNIEHKAELAHFLANQATEKPTIWHLHGSIEDASRIILTQDGYKLLYSDDTTESLYRAALTTFRSLLTTHTLLFIGCSFSDEHIGMQLEGMASIFDGCVGPHYALIKEEEKSKLKSLGLPVEPIVFNDFGEPLIESIEELACCYEKELPDTPTVVAIPLPPSTISAPSYHPGNPVFHVPYAQKGDQVIGRDEKLSVLRKQLTEGKRTAIGHTASFHGLGGLGKTQLAVEYAYQFRDSYPNGIIWLNADQDIDAQLTELAVSAKWIAPETEHKDKLAIAVQRLRSYGDCLIIFDNLENQELIRPYLPNPGVEAHIIVTSRSDQPGFTPIPLDPLDPDHSFELLCQESCREVTDPEEESAAREIASILGGLPLAIELAGAYLCHRRSFTFAEYLKRLRDDPLKALPEKYLTSFTAHDADLFRTLKINEELIAEEPLLSPILDLLTWSGPAAMGIDLIAHLLDKKTVDLSAALALGVDLRILQKSPGVDRYALHRLVREVRRVEFPLSERKEWAEQKASKLGDWFEDLREEFINLPRYEAEIDHLTAWCDNSQEWSQLNARLIWLQAYPPYHRGNYKIAHDIVKQAFLLIEKDEIDQCALGANILCDYGATFGFLGDFKNSLHFEEQGLEIRRFLYGERHPDTATSYSNLGNTYGELGDHKKALEYQQKALEIRLELFGDKHPNTAASYNNLGGTYGELGDHKKALEYQQKALEINRDGFGEIHPDTARLLNNIGHEYYCLGKIPVALDAINKALKIARQFYPNTHPMIIDKERGLQQMRETTKGFRKKKKRR